MKRGFLNTSKGRATMSAPTTSSSSTAKSPAPFIDLSSQSQKTVNVDRYEPEIDFKELDGTRTDHDDLEWIVSRQPSTEPDATVSQYPDGWAECLITGRVKRVIVSFQGFPEALPHSDPTRPKPYELRESLGKGMGMFATPERPLLIVPAAFTMISVPLHFTEAQRHQAVLNQTEQMLEKMVDRMPGSTIFSPGLPDNTRYYTGVCNMLSRINHSCCPNSDRDWNSPTFSFFLRSACSIKKDEEITICYNGDILDPTASRQRRLASYGFRCSSLGDVKGEKTDPALKELELIEAEGLQSAWRNMGPGYEDEVKKYKDPHRTYQLVNMGARKVDTKKQKEDEAKISPNAIDVIRQMMAG
ncbi:hypothetical protein K435DRAFT_781362 [Dendrothele bispora CBS 962.96]|uniref:SET domain-containing protein n=1 Tax=Dendrothele bispora (strain CBS 962.96) TaxID=1314807 RepID=A0A4S8LLH7_DENBC|nr:hypothetical protein K435DRAFT_781362 [Dendrothele bispora CBS 962.96]